jgi:hypothetical protein
MDPQGGPGGDGALFLRIIFFPTDKYFLVRIDEVHSKTFLVVSFAIVNRKIWCVDTNAVDLLFSGRYYYMDQGFVMKDLQPEGRIITMRGI